MLALTMTTVANVLITMAMGPFFTALVARVVLGQRIDARKHRDEPVALLGDFNSTEGNPAVDLLAGRSGGWSHALLDTYQALHAGVKARRTLHFWNNNKDGWAKVDHILVSKPCQIAAAEIGYPAAKIHPASDHFPVFSRVRWP
jgi:endonuclease/exonuclease/phosphatase family metal-dependent hydrolase